jgi:hypothetical protein
LTASEADAGRSDSSSAASRRPALVCSDIQQFKISPYDTPQIVRKKQGNSGTRLGEILSLGEILPLGEILSLAM